MFKIFIRKIRQSKEGKVLVSNFAYLSLLQIAGYVFPLLTLPYLARVIGVEGFGKIAFATAIMGWIQTIADWGFNYTATRDVARNRNDINKISEIFSNVLWSRIFLMMMSFICLCVLVLCVSKFRVNADVIFVSFLMIPGHILFPEWFFQAIERMKYITLLNVLSKFVFTIAIFAFVREKNDYILQPLFVSLGFIISGVISFCYISFKWKVRVIFPSYQRIFHTIKNSTDVFVNNLMPNFYNSFSSVFLGFVGGDVSNGKLDAGNKFVMVASQFVQIISRVFYPFLSRKIDKYIYFERINIIVGIVITIFLIVMSPVIIDLFFTIEFRDSVMIMRILSLSIFFLILSNTYGTNYLILIGKERQLRNITLICSISGMLVAVPLIYFYDFYGAAITITFSRAILGLSIMFYAKKSRKLFL